MSVTNRICTASTRLMRSASWAALSSELVNVSGAAATYTSPAGATTEPPSLVMKPSAARRLTTSVRSASLRGDCGEIATISACMRPSPLVEV